MRRPGWTFLAAVLVAGCRAGRDEVIFVTRTNVAIDFDTVPLTTEIGFKRDEAVLSPVDRNGRVLPVLTSVGVNAGALSFGANHSFATGDAAILMAEYLGKDTDLAADAGIETNDAIDPSKLRRGLKGNEIAADGRESYVFGTNTILGLGVTWNANSVPTAVTLGYKRKELAIVPLKEVEGEPGKLSLASLIATADGGAQVTAPDGTGIVVGQTFATGQAATYLATHPQIRRAIAPAIVPGYAAAEAKKVEAANAPRVAQQDSMDAVRTWYRDAAHPPTAAQKAKVRLKAIDLHLIPGDVGTGDDDVIKALQRTVNKADPDNAAAFQELAAFLSQV